MNLKFTKCTIADLDTLREFSAKTFIETFESTNSEENMNEYLAKEKEKNYLLIPELL